jgi:hypothetical protein
MDWLMRSRSMSLTITIDRTEGGRFRALVAEQPRLVMEHDELSELVEELKLNLDMIAVMPDGRLLLIQAEEMASVKNLRSNLRTCERSESASHGVVSGVKSRVDALCFGGISRWKSLGLVNSQVLEAQRSSFISP